MSHLEIDGADVTWNAARGTTLQAVFIDLGATPMTEEAARAIGEAYRRETDLAADVGLYLAYRELDGINRDIKV
jgi:hypothetical protein